MIMSLFVMLSPRHQGEHVRRFERLFDHRVKILPGSYGDWPQSAKNAAMLTP